MKRLILFFLVIALLLCGCAAQSTADTANEETAGLNSISKQKQKAENNTTSDTIDDELYDLCRQMDSSLGRALDMYECKIAVSQRDGKIDLTVFLEAMPNDFVFFDILSLSKFACKKYESENDFEYNTVLVYDGTSELGMLSWSGENFDTGFFMDSKKPYAKTMTYEELVKYFEFEDIYEDLYGGENGEK